MICTSNTSTASTPINCHHQLETRCGRKPELLGTTLEDRATVDALLEGIDDLYLKYIDCVYSDQLSPPARDALWAKHFNPMTAAERNGGGHLRFIDGFLERSGGPFLLGEYCTIA